jgi:hypothetical protein
MMNMHPIISTLSGFRRLWAFRGPAAFVILLTLLLGANLGVAQAVPVNASQKPPPQPWSAYPVASGTVTDVDFDGQGDWVGGQTGSALVGFNCIGQTSNIGPGEQRGVEVFDLSTAPKIKGQERVMLVLNNTGTRLSSDLADHNVTLYVGKGDGTVDLADFPAGRLALAFDMFNNDPSLFPYDFQFDVTKTVRRAMSDHNRYVTFVLRPDPALMTNVGCFIFSGTGFPDPSGQFVPDMLVIGE